MENPHGTVTEQEAYDMFSVLFLCVFENVLPENGWILRKGVKQLGDLVNKLIELSISQAAPTHSGVRKRISFIAFNTVILI